MSLKLVTRTGSPYLYLRGTDNEGRPVFRSTKVTDRAAAEDILTKANAALLDERVHGPIAVTKFVDAARAYIKNGGEKRFLFAEREDRDSGLIPHFGPDKLMREITQDDLDAAADALCPGASVATMNRNVYTPFIAVWNYAAAESRKWAAPKKWERRRAKKKGTAVRPKVTRSGTRPIDYERAWKFVSSLSPSTAIIFTAFFYSGVRPIEYFALDEQEVNVDGRWIVLLNTKTGEPRGVGMHEMLVPMFRALKAAAADREVKRIFLNARGQPYELTNTEEGINGQFKGAVKSARARLAKAGTPMRDVSAYTARHTVSTRLVMNDVQELIKDQLLGHAVTTMSRVYTYVPQVPIIEAVNTLPVIDEWANAPWLLDPVRYMGRRFYSPVTMGMESRIVEMRKAGMSMPEIGRQLGIHKASVFSVLQRDGLAGERS